MVLMSLQVLLCSFVKVACLVKTAAFLIPPADEIKKKKKGDLVQTDVCCPMRTQKAPFRLLAVFISGIGTTHIVLKTAVYSLKTCPN